MGTFAGGARQRGLRAAASGRGQAPLLTFDREKPARPPRKHLDRERGFASHGSTSRRKTAEVTEIAEISDCGPQGRMSRTWLVRGEGLAVGGTPAPAASLRRARERGCLAFPLFMSSVTQFPVMHCANVAFTAGKCKREWGHYGSGTGGGSAPREIGPVNSVFYVAVLPWPRDTHTSHTPKMCTSRHVAYSMKHLSPSAFMLELRFWCRVSRGPRDGWATENGASLPRFSVTSCLRTEAGGSLHTISRGRFGRAGDARAGPARPNSTAPVFQHLARPEIWAALPSTGANGARRPAPGPAVLSFRSVGYPDLSFAEWGHGCCC